MTISDETEKKIDAFAQEQSRYYLDRTQMTYWEKAQAKVDKTRRKAGAKAAKFKMRSDQAQEAQEDLQTYMNDFIEDLLEQGVSEEEAYERAAKELAHDSKTSMTDDLYEHYAEKFYDQFNAFGDFGGFGSEEGGVGSGAVIGLYYSGGVIVGAIVGALIGIILGFLFFSGLFWVGAIVGFFAGAALGVGFAMLAQARAINKHR